MKKLLFTFALFFCLSTQAAAPLIWLDGSYAGFLSTKGFKLFDGKIYQTLSVDPTAGAGVVAAVGSIGVRSNAGSGEVWVKSGAADTAWVNILTGSTGWSLLGNAGTTAGTNFIGTSDSRDLVFKTNGTEVFRFTSAGAYDTTFSTGLLHSDSSGILTSSTLVNADVNASAAIAYSKLAAMSTGQALLGNAGTPTATTLSGDVTVGATGVTAIGATKVTNAMLAGSIDLTTKVTGVLPRANGGTGLSTAGTSGNLLTSNGTDWVSSAPATSGTVTSVALSVPATSIFGVTGSPVTSSGTLGLTTTGTSGGIPYFSSTSALSSSALLTANALVLGGGAGTSPATLGTLGTTTTLLHGNAAGAPTFGAVSLTADVSGTLPVANGGSGTSTVFTTGSVVFTGASGVRAQNNANFFWDNTNARLGIGTAAPVSALHVNTTPTASAAMGATSLGAGPWDGSTSGFFAGNSSGTVLALNSNGFAGNLFDAQAGSNHVTIGSTGGVFVSSSIGVGTAATYKIDSTTGSLARTLNIANTNTGTLSYGGYFSKTGAATTGVGIYATATGATNNYAAIFDQGRVGIGTTTPNEQLEITGNLRMPMSTGSTVGVVYNGANRFMHGYGDASNTFVGVTSGNFTLTSIYSTGIGRGTLSALTSGNNNTAVGTDAGLALTSGGSNMLLGSAAGAALTTGSNNVAIGQSSLSAATTSGSIVAVGAGSLSVAGAGGSNTGVGRNALASSTGAGNSALGSNAGFDNATGTNNVFIGFNSQNGGGGGTGLSESVAIGHNSTVTTSNTMVLGGTSAFSTQVAINATTATGQFDVNNNSASRIGAIIKGAASQSANLQEWQNSSATALASVSSAGVISTPTLKLNGSTSGTLTVNPAATTSSHTLTFPSAQGTANTLLKNDGSGGLSWSAASLTTDVSGVLPLANGGTNANLTASNGAIPYSTASAMAFLAPGSSGQVLTSGGAGAPTWGSSLTNPMTTGGDIIYGGSAGAATRLANGSAGQYLRSSGTTVAPTWASILTSEITGTSTNDSASSGKIGEFISNVRSSALTLTTLTSGHAFDCDTNATVSGGETINATGIALTAGDWEITGNIYYTVVTAAVTSISSLAGWYGTATGNSTTGRSVGANYIVDNRTFQTLNGSEFAWAMPSQRVSLSGTTTYYLKGQPVFVVGAGGFQCFGTIQARRMR